MAYVDRTTISLITLFTPQQMMDDGDRVNFIAFALAAGPRQPLGLAYDLQARRDGLFE